LYEKFICMKNLFSCALAALLFVFFIASCAKKDEITLSQQDNSLSELKITTDSYISSLASSPKIDNNTPQVQGFWDRIRNVLTVIGDLAGGAAGWGIGGPIGAIIGGGAASALMYYEINDGNPIVPKDETVAYAAANPNNPFDYVGYYHYYTMNQIAKPPNDYINTDGTFSTQKFHSFSGNLLQQQGVITYTQFNNLSLSSVENNLLYIKSNLNYSNSSVDVNGFLNTIHTDGRINSGSKDALVSYFNALQSFSRLQSATVQDINNFISYSTTMENTVASSALNSDDKAMVLSTMATARYGVHYWLK